ncbi:uncharacterized protein LOC6562001 [Drosophila grimshawi]|uniref:GH11204 n=1 Tax=Drosophila grimshawi TaxID=7222 RepID=B4JDK0_DROGR|nr:uncharacterized protein LOC6562001 [Drosophila grimshawi]EDW03370.1 GH11204 [Drosophila grimshawi]
MAESAKLQSVDLQGLRNLQALYRRDLPKHCQEFYILKNFIAFLKIEPEMKHLNVYTLRDQRAKELGLFLIVDRYQLFVGCLGECLNLLELALNLLDWSKGLLCSTIPDRYMSTVFKVVQQKGLTVDYHHRSHLYHLPAKHAQQQLQVKCPTGFYLQSLTERDAHLINQEWSYNQEGSLYFIQRQIRLCPSMGLYDNETHELVAWCIRDQDGLLTVLQVKQTHQRRGFGSLIVQALSQRIAELGDDIIAEIYPGNLASVRIFDKFGFRMIDHCHWLNIQPENGDFTWPDGQ